MNEKVTAVNSILEAGEPGNISVDEHSGYTGYKPQSVVDACNEVLWGEWGFDEISNEIIAGEKGGIAVAQVKVWMKGVDFKPTGWGQNRVTRGDIGDARKGAQTDAIKKALSYFSIGNRAYHGLLSADKPATRSQGNSGRVQNTAHNHTNNQTTTTTAASQSGSKAQQNTTNLSDIPTVQKLRESAKTLKIEWDTVLTEAFEKPIADGKVTLQALQAKGDELPPGYCQRIASYLQAKQAA